MKKGDVGNMGKMGNKSGEQGIQENGKEEKTVKSFLSLDVYQNIYKAARTAIFQIIPKLPKAEAFDLADQMRRAAKAISALIAEGYAKKYQQRGYVRYLTEASAEANEMIVHLSFAREYIKYECELIDGLIDVYNISRKQLYKLRRNWDSLNKTDS
jgi:four helix bundle protein